MMTSSGDNNGRVGVWVCSPTKLKKIPKIPKAEQETAQPTAARFKKPSRLTNVKTALFKLLGAHKKTPKYLATTFCEKALLGNNLKDG